jgi:hypothetical protein
MLCLRGDMYPILLCSSCAFRDDFILFSMYKSSNAQQANTELHYPHFYLYEMLYLTRKCSELQQLILHSQMIIFSV